ncbi:MAG: porin [Succinivibrio sp.]|nr:porin [Succinivibrio sp.]
MKKLYVAPLAGALALGISLPSQAVEVYNKDGTSFAIGGRIEAVYVSGNASNAGNKDQTIRNRMRLNLKGRTQINDYLAAYAFTEWQQQNQGDSSGGQTWNVRDQYVGLDLGQYGKIQAGRFLSGLYDLTVLTDIFNDYANLGAEVASRNSGKLKYIYSGYGFDFGAELQTSENNYTLDHVTGTHHVDSGYTLTAGYTIPDVAFGPLGFKAGFEYLRFQDDHGTTHDSLSNSKTWGVAAFWGTYGKGLFLAADYTARDIAARESYASDDFKQQGLEVTATYFTESGINLTLGYESQRLDPDLGSATHQTNLLGLVEYYFVPNFKIWAGATWDLDTDKNYGKDGNGYRIAALEVPGDIYTVGARYSF